MSQGTMEKVTRKVITGAVERTGAAFGGIRTQVSRWGQDVAQSMRELVSEAREEYEAEQVALEEVRSARMVDG